MPLRRWAAFKHSKQQVDHVTMQIAHNNEPVVWKRQLDQHGFAPEQFSSSMKYLKQVYKAA